MDIDLLSQMVYDLILENDRVSLPGVGAFVAEMMPATFTDRGYTINPPYRKLSFRTAGPSDTLLVDLYAVANKVAPETAERVIVEFLSEMKAILFVKKTVVFPGLGRLRATRENNVFFVADEGLDIFPEGFGLEPLSLKTRQETAEDINRSVERLGEILNGPEPAVEPKPAMEPEPAAEEVSQPAVETQLQVEKTQSRSRRLWRGIGIAAAVLAASAAILIGGFIILAHTAPSFVDSLLYTPEELSIINWKL